MEEFRNQKMSSDFRYDERDIQGHSYIIVPYPSRPDDFRNNNHITVNPFDENRTNLAPFSVIMDECDLLNNNMTLTNGNILSVSLTSPNSATVTSSIQSSENCLKFCHRKAKINHSTLIETRDDLNAQTIKSPKKISNFQNYDEKFSNNKKDKKKKKKKEKPKALRGPAGGAGAGGGRGRGMSEQEQMMKKPRRKTKKEEK